MGLLLDVLYYLFDCYKKIPLAINITDSSTSDEKKDYEKWDRSNHMSLTILKCGIPKVFRGTISEDITIAKDFLAEIEKRFMKSNKAETSALLQSLITMKYQGRGSVREYILEMSNIISKLKTVKLELREGLLVH